MLSWNLLSFTDLPLLNRSYNTHKLKAAGKIQLDPLKRGVVIELELPTNFFFYNNVERFSRLRTQHCELILA